MLAENKHLTTDEIIRFLDNAFLPGTETETDEYFSAISHFVDCKECREKKDEYLDFLEELDVAMLALRKRELDCNQDDSLGK